MEDARLREALERTTAALARMPDAGLAEGDPRYRWWYDEAAPALAEAREALAAVPEAPAHRGEYRRPRGEITALLEKARESEALGSRPVNAAIVEALEWVLEPDAEEPRLD